MSDYTLNLDEQLQSSLFGETTHYMKDVAFDIEDLLFNDYLFEMVNQYEE